MSHHPRRVKSSSSFKKGCSTCSSPATYVQLELPLDIEGKAQTTELLTAQQEKLSCTVELAAANSKTNTTENQTTDNSCNIESELSNSEPQDSSNNSKVYKPFWDKFCLEMSEKLWSTISTSVENFSSGLSGQIATNSIQNSWFCVALIDLVKESESKTSWQLSMSPRLNDTDSAYIAKKTKKIRIFPELTLGKLYRKWLAAGRWCYNAAIAPPPRLFYQQY